ncbi:GDSL esterase/lipase 6 [Ancistrocladus abbreviatus]
MEKLIFLPSFLLINLFISSHSYQVPGIFIFGDSIFDAGNNHFIKNCTAQADFLPYGFNFFHYPTGRFTNGRTVADFIAEFMGIEMQKPYLQVQMELLNGSRKEYPSNGINFASAASGVLQATNRDLEVIPLQIQLQQFQVLIQQNQLVKNQIEQSLFFLESGSNDIFNYFIPFGSPKPEPHSYLETMLTEVRHFVDEIYLLGARRIAIFSLGPVGCVPARALLPDAPLHKCYGKMNRMVKDYNSGLEAIVKDFPAKYPGAVAVYGAVYDMVQLFRANPARYGFTNVTSACCGDGPLGGSQQCGREGYRLCFNPNQFLFWDYFHPSEHTYKLISKTLWNGNRSQIRPLNLKSLASTNHTRA